jgi:enoyl-CoA hydratase
MTSLVTYQADGPVAAITMDDGKVNALSGAMFAALGEAVDRAEADQAAVLLLAGRPGIFSAGFDLSVLRAGGEPALDMIGAGFELTARLLAHPAPVVIACPGHAYAMAAFLLLSADYRIGAEGPYRITTNEVAIGLPVPRVGIELCRQRLSPAYLTRALLLAEVLGPAQAVTAGFLDETLPAGEVLPAARDLAASLAKLDAAAHAESKRRLRQPAVTAIRAAIAADRDVLDGQPPA